MAGLRRWISAYLRNQKTRICLSPWNYNSQASLMKLAENSSRISEIECRLGKYTYLSRNGLPGYPDGVVFLFLAANNAFPDRTLHPNFYHWYILMRQFHSTIIGKWVADRLYHDPHDTLPSKFTSQETPSPPPSACRRSCTDENINLSNFDPKNTESLEQNGAAFVIDILLRGQSCGEAERLRMRLEGGEWAGGVEVVIVREGEVKVRCRQRICKCDEIANFISRSVEFRKLQIKRERKAKTLLV